MNEPTKIRDLSVKYDVSARALRYYEDMGLIQSTRSDDYAYRLYDDAAVRRLEQILILRKLNISIKDIRRIFNTSGSEVVLEVLGKKVAAIDEEVSLLHELRAIVLEFIRQIEQFDFGNESDIQLLYEKAKEIETQLVNVDYEGNPSTVNRLLEVTGELERLPNAVRKYPRLQICIGGLGSDEANKEAFSLYQEAFKAIKTWEEQPYDSGPENLHIGMEINEYDFLLKTQGRPYPGGGVGLGVHFSNEEDWRRAYDALTREGSDYATQSWPHAPVSGLVTDKFGVSWWLHT